MLVGNGQTILIFWNAKRYHFASWPGAGRQGQIGLSQGGFGSPRIGRKCRINDVDQRIGQVRRALARRDYPTSS